MKIRTNSISDGNPEHEVITSVDIALDNGEVYRLTEIRETASTCDLRVTVHGVRALNVAPIDKRTVQIGRRQ